MSTTDTKSPVQQYQFNLSFPPGVSLDSPGCLRKKNSPSWNPCWPALEPPLAGRAANPGTQSMSGTSCRSGEAPFSTGRQACCWFARCATAASAALCCGPTGAAAGKPGTRTAFPRFRGSAEPCFHPRREQSPTPATLRIVRDVWEGTAGSERSIRYRNQIPTVPNECWLAGFQPDNEHH